MSPEENKAAARRAYDGVFNQHDLSLVDELIDERFVDHDSPSGEAEGTRA